MNESQDIFERGLTYPDADARQRFGELVGIDDAKVSLVKTLRVFINPYGLFQWNEKQYGKSAQELVNRILRRPPLVVLAGDVGTGKTQLAESVGDTLAREENIDITLFPVSLSARGSGRVGEMTRLISSAFDKALEEGEKRKSKKGKPTSGIILLIDEADALAQSRELAQMHHEDRAGVNAFIRGVDRLTESRTSVAVIMCTNRLSAIDPAVKRRAAEIIEFGRPNENQRKLVLGVLKEVGFGEEQVSQIAQITGEKNGNTGFTYSDLTQRLIPAIVLDAYPDSPVEFERALKIAQAMKPTPTFREES